MGFPQKVLNKLTVAILAKKTLSNKQSNITSEIPGAIAFSLCASSSISRCNKFDEHAYGSKHNQAASVLQRVFKPLTWVPF